MCPGGGSPGKTIDKTGTHRDTNRATPGMAVDALASDRARGRQIVQLIVDNRGVGIRDDTKSRMLDYASIAYDRVLDGSVFDLSYV